MTTRTGYIPTPLHPYFERFLNREPYLYITKEECNYILKNFEKQKGRIQLANVMVTYPPPIKEHSLKDCYVDYLRLKSTRLNELFVEGEWNFRNEKNFNHSTKLDGKNIYIRRIVTGNIASDYFHIRNRWSSPSFRFPEPINAWNQHKYSYLIAGAFYTLGFEEFNLSTFKTMTALRIYICSQFKPNVAKAIYDYFKAETVLDFSMGWGDRLVGFFAANTAKLYVGMDPKVDNHPIYNEQAKAYQSWNGWFDTEKRTDFIIDPAEDADLSKYENKIDLVFTSPPYFNTEIYSNEENQSCNRYKTIDDWNNLFLYKAIDNVWRTLKVGGHMLINIADVNHGKGGGYMNICDRMIEYMEENHQSKYMGAIGMQMTLRPNSAVRTEEFEGDKNSVFAEPCWIFKKLG